MVHDLEMVLAGHEMLRGGYMLLIMYISMSAFIPDVGHWIVHIWLEKVYMSLELVHIDREKVYI